MKRTFGRGGPDVPAVWVPLAPAALEGAASPPPAVGAPMVLVPFQATVALPQAGQPPAPWAPDYLAAPAAGAEAPLGQAGLSAYLGYKKGDPAGRADLAARLGARGADVRAPAGDPQDDLHHG